MGASFHPEIKTSYLGVWKEGSPVTTLNWQGNGSSIFPNLPHLTYIDFLHERRILLQGGVNTSSETMWFIRKRNEFSLKQPSFLYSRPDPTEFGALEHALLNPDLWACSHDKLHSPRMGYHSYLCFAKMGFESRKTYKRTTCSVFSTSKKI